MGYKYLEGVVFDELPDDLVGIVLGAPYAWMWMTGEIKFHSPTLPLASKSKMGWILVGPGMKDRVEEPPMSHLNLILNYSSSRRKFCRNLKMF